MTVDDKPIELLEQHLDLFLGAVIDLSTPLHQSNYYNIYVCKKSKQSTLLALWVVIRIVAMESFLLAGSDSIEDEVSASEWLSMVFIDGLLDASEVSVVDVCESFEVFVGPVPYHPQIRHNSTRTELFTYLFLFDIIRQILDKQTLATHRNIDLLIAHFLALALGGFHLQVSAAHRFSAACQHLLILFLLIEHHMRVAETPSRILELGQLDLHNRIGCKKGRKLILSSGVGQSADEHLEKGVGLRLLLFLHHQQSIYNHKINYSSSSSFFQGL